MGRGTSVNLTEYLIDDPVQLGPHRNEGKLVGHGVVLQAVVKTLGCSQQNRGIINHPGIKRLNVYRVPGKAGGER
jgi:hypothetical protein